MPSVRCLSLDSDQGPHREILPQNGFDLHWAPPEADPFDEDQLITLLQGFDAVVAGSEPYSRRVIEAVPRLRVIARSGVGYDAIDLEACDEAGVVVTITPGVNHHAVAEHTIALLMGVARGFPETDRRVRENRWKRIARPRVMGRTLGIVGLGRIGRAVATRAVGLGLKVVAFEPAPDQRFVQQWNIQLTDFDDLLARSDYVTLHLPASAETRHLINAETLAKMKPGSVLINTSRGSLVDEEALCEALRSGHLRAAGLDVFEQEPLPLDSPLLTFDNVLLSGHVAGLDEESHTDTYAMLANTIVELYNGGWPDDRIVNLKG
ncbi:MAG TPA: 3-phosphoglycerate dehydrogenase, partial [Planctomycetaceae bacterium]|nr:3-phosphoglycerate dehydrogenase [Planctomycetaceae bacterium]